MPASGASLLLNAESVFTAVLAWVAFKENFDRRIALGMLAIVAGALVLSWPGDAHFAGIWPALSVLAACLAWGIDNNLTRKVSLTDAAWIASVKGLVAGSVNLGLAWALGERPPALVPLAGAIGRRLSGLRGQPGPVCSVPAAFGHGTHRRLFFSGAVLRHLAGLAAGGYHHLATGRRRRADGLGRVAAPDGAAPTHPPP